MALNLSKILEKHRILFDSYINIIQYPFYLIDVESKESFLLISNLESDFKNITLKDIKFENYISEKTSYIIEVENNYKCIAKNIDIDEKPLFVIITAPLLIEKTSSKKDATYINDEKLQTIKDNLNTLGEILKDIISILLENLKLSEKTIKPESEPGLLIHAMKNSSTATVIFSKDHRILFVNKEFCNISGYSEEEITKLGIMDIVPEFDEENWKSHWENCKRLGQNVIKTEFKDNKAEQRPFLLLIKHFEYQGEEYHICFVFDSSEQKVLKKKLDEYYELLNLQFENLKFKEHELIKPHAVLLSSIEQSAAGITIVEAENIALKYCNPRGQKILGIENNYVKKINTNIEELLFKIYRAENEEIPIEEFPVARAILKKECVINEENIIINKEGNAYNIISNAAPVLDEKGNVVAGILVFLDVTEHKKRLKQIHESERKYSLLFNSISEGLIFYDAIYSKDKKEIIDFKVSDLNPAYEDIIGLKREQILGKTLREIYKENNISNVDLWVKIYGELTKSGYNTVFYRKFYLPGKMYFVNAFRPRPGTLAIDCRDVTEEKHLEEELIDAKNKFQTISDYANDSIIMADSTGKIIYSNNSSERIFGYKYNDIIGSKINRLFNIRTFSELIDKSHKYSGNTIETVIYKKNKEKIFVEFSVTLMEIKGEYIYVFITRDISQRKKLEQQLFIERKNLEKTVEKRTEQLNKSLISMEEVNLQLLAANKHKTDFLSTMSHELRTPLNAIIGFNHLLNLQYFGPLNEKQFEYINFIGESSKHLLSLINDLLDISKIDTGSVEMNVVNTKIGPIIQEIALLMSSQFKAKSINLNMDIDDNIKSISVDVTKLKQILINLLANALKFTDIGGSVELIAFKNNNKEIKISIIDSGMGISKEDQEKVFNEFYQTKRAKTRALGGAGIGLALTKRLVELHGGTIGVISEEEKGSEFWFTLPIKKARVPALV